MYSLGSNSHKESKRRARKAFNTAFYKAEMSPEDRVKILQAFNKILDAYSAK